MKARFDVKQKPLEYFKQDQLEYFLICVNEEEVEGEREKETVTIYEYDYRELVVPEGNIDFAEIEEHPELFLDYELSTQTLEEVVNDLKSENAELRETVTVLNDAILEMSEIVYGEE